MIIASTHSIGVTEYQWKSIDLDGVGMGLGGFWVGRWMDFK